jgi:hypothetical protein
MCQCAEGSLIHYFWACPYIKTFGLEVVQETDTVFECSLQLGATSSILGTRDELPLRFRDTSFTHFTILCAKMYPSSRINNLMGTKGH